MGQSPESASHPGTAVCRHASIRLQLPGEHAPRQAPARAQSDPVKHARRFARGKSRCCFFSTFAAAVAALCRRHSFERLERLDRAGKTGPNAKGDGEPCGAIAFHRPDGPTFARFRAVPTLTIELAL